jgi:hypothetical protein
LTFAFGNESALDVNDEVSCWIVLNSSVATAREKEGFRLKQQNPQRIKLGFAWDLHKTSASLENSTVAVIVTLPIAAFSSQLTSGPTRPAGTGPEFYTVLPRAEQSRARLFGARLFSLEQIITTSQNHWRFGLRSQCRLADFTPSPPRFGGGRFLQRSDSKIELIITFFSLNQFFSYIRRCGA